MYSQSLGMSGRPTKVDKGRVFGICRMFAGRYCCELGVGSLEWEADEEDAKFAGIGMGTRRVKIRTEI